VAHHNDANGFAAMSPAAFEAVCAAMKGWQIANGFASDHFAWPRGKHTRALREVAARYFSSQRTFRTTLNRFEADIYPFADATRLRLRADRVARLGYARLAFLNAGNTNYSAVDLLTNDSGIADDGEWLTVEVAKGDLSEPLINMAAIDRIMLRESALAAANPVQVNLQSIATRPEPASGCLVLAFDDGWRGQYANAFPAMTAAGLRGSVYVICDQHGPSGGGLYMNRAELRALQAAGWDIGCHADTVAHHNDANGFAAMSPAAFEAVCAAMKGWQIANGFASDHFAWPRGKHTKALRDVAARYFSSQRTFRTNLNRFEADIYPFADTTRLRQCAVTGGTTPSAVATVTALIDACMAARKTLILTFHDIGNGGASTEYPVASFAAIVSHVATRHYPVRTLTEVFARGV
jgi:hypothetical protein